MKYVPFIKKSAFIAAAALLTLAACKRSSNTSTASLTNADDNGGYASDAAKLETNNNDVISITDVAAAGSGSTLRTTETSSIGCATVNTVTPGVITITFPAAGCTCADTKTRSGEIIVNYTGAYKDSGSVHTITFNNYFVNGNQVKGRKTVTNMGTNASGQVYYNVAVNDTMVVGTDSVISWVGNRTRTWLAGYTTADRSDDEYLIGGTTTLTRANGHTFTFTITAPLQVAMTCPYIEAGVVAITGTTIPGTYTLDYGTGDCDALAKVTIGSGTYNIVLH